MRTNLLLIASLCVLGCRSTSEHVVAEERAEPTAPIEITAVQNRAGQDSAAQDTAAQDTAADMADREETANEAIRFYAEEAAERGQANAEADARARAADARARESESYAREMEAYARWLEREGVAAVPVATAAQPITDEQAMAARHAQLVVRQAAAEEAAAAGLAAAAVPAPVVFVPRDATLPGQASTRVGTAPSTRTGDAAVTAGGTPGPVTGGVPQPQPAGVPAPNAGAQVGGIPRTGDAPSVPAANGAQSGVQRVQPRAAAPGAAPVQGRAPIAPPR
jgi:hypothetical protein